MPEIKNTFLKGKMNKDLDERLIPNGEYRDALNVEVSTSEGADVGTVQNVLGNYRLENIVDGGFKCVGSIENEKTNKLYWFVSKYDVDAILEYDVTNDITLPILVDTNAGNYKAVLKFSGNIITGINIIDNLLFWTDNNSEPKKINIDDCKEGTPDMDTHTQLLFENGSFDGITISLVSTWSGASASHTQYFDGTSTRRTGRYAWFETKQLKALLGDSYDWNPTQIDVNGEEYDFVDIRHYRDGKFLGIKNVTIRHDEGGTRISWSDPSQGAPFLPENHEDLAWHLGDVIFGNNISLDIEERHITVIKPKPLNAFSVKINHAETDGSVSSVPNLFETKFPRFSYRYKYRDGEYSPFAPFTTAVFNAKYPKDTGLAVDSNSFYDKDNIYTTKDPYNKAMINSIHSVDLSDFINAQTPEDVIEVDILYKQEESSVIYSIDTIKHIDNAWHAISSHEGLNLKLGAGKSTFNIGDDALGVSGSYIAEGGFTKGRYLVTTENIYAALPANQLLRPWDNVPKKALAQEITGNRIVYGNYVQNYDLVNDAKVSVSYSNRKNTIASFATNGLPSVKSQRNYQVGVVYCDKFGRETPVFTSKTAAVNIPWQNASGKKNASKSNQLNASVANNFPDWVDSLKFFVKETSNPYYNLTMERAWVTKSTYDLDNSEGHLWLSFPSSDRNKISEDDYLVLKKKIGVGEEQIGFENKYKVIDIQNEAPDAIKYELVMLGVTGNGNDKLTDDSWSNNYDALFTNNGVSRIDVVNTDILKIDAHHWTSGGSFRRPLIKPQDTGYDGDAVNNESDILLDNMYVSWKKTNSGLGASKKYKVSGGWKGDEKYVLKLAEPISRKDADLAHLTGKASTGVATGNMYPDLNFAVQRRELKEAEDFSGKFFVKISKNQVTDAIEYKSAQNYQAAINPDDNFEIKAKDFAFQFHDTQNSSHLTGSGNYGITNSVGQFCNRTGQNNILDVANNTIGEQNAENYLSGGSDLSVNNGTGTITDYAEMWAGIQATISAAAYLWQLGMGSGSLFFHDAMHMVAGQSDASNYAKYCNVTWSGTDNTNPDIPDGSCWSYPPVKTWLTDYKDTLNLIKPGSDGESITTSLTGASIRVATPNFPAQSVYYQNNLITTNPFGPNNTDYQGLKIDGWVGPLQNVTRKEPTNFVADNHINGLEGFLWETNDNHTTGPRRWFSGMDGSTHGNGEDTKTYGDKPGKHFIHLSYFAPGQDLHTGDFSNLQAPELYGPHSFAATMEGIWGGGVFTGQHPDEKFGNPTSGLEEDKFFHFPMEGNNDSDGKFHPEAPGPGVGYGYNTGPQPSTGISCRELHERQWDPTFSKSLVAGGAHKRRITDLRNFIRNLYPGSQFRFSTLRGGQIGNFVPSEGTRIYTIKKVQVKKLYNHTSWRKTFNRFVDNTIRYIGTPESSDNGTLTSDHVAYQSVEETALRFLDQLDENGVATAAQNPITDFKKKIVDFGAAHNRRLCYVIELDKIVDPANDYGIKGISADLTDGDISDIEFIDPIEEINLSDLNKHPAIWELSPKKSEVDLDIYYEASSNIPVRLNEKTNELFAPIGCTVDVLNSNITGTSYLESWDGNIAKLYPGLPKGDGEGNEINYTEMSFKFTRQDGSYTIAEAGLQDLDGVSEGVKTNFTFREDIGGVITHGLDWYNCFSFGNGLESNRIRDGFNEIFIGNGVKASTVTQEAYKEERRRSGLIYSGIYNSNSGVNDLNQFIQAEKITKDLNPTYGSIQKLFQRRISLIAFCEDRVIGITSNKDTIFNADGNPQLIASNKVLGDANPFEGNYGISTNPESFAAESYRAYFADKQRGVVVRLSKDGLTPISSAGMKDWFRDNLPEYNILLGTYDSYKDDYNITLSNDSGFNENLLLDSYLETGIEIDDTVEIGSGNKIENPGVFNATPLNYLYENNDVLSNDITNMFTWNDGNSPTFSDDAINFKGSAQVINHGPIGVGDLQPAVGAQGAEYADVFGGDQNEVPWEQAVYSTWDNNSTSAVYLSSIGLPDYGWWYDPDFTTASGDLFGDGLLNTLADAQVVGVIQRTIEGSNITESAAVGPNSPLAVTPGGYSYKTNYFPKKEKGIKYPIASGGSTSHKGVNKVSGCITRNSGVDAGTAGAITFDRCDPTNSWVTFRDIGVSANYPSGAGVNDHYWNQNPVGSSSNAHNRMYNGDEITVQFELTCFITGGSPQFDAPTQRYGYNFITPQLSLWDGADMSSPISSDKLCIVSTQGNFAYYPYARLQTTNLGPDFEDLSISAGYAAGTNVDYKQWAGLQASSTVDFSNTTAIADLGVPDILPPNQNLSGTKTVACSATFKFRDPNQQNADGSLIGGYGAGPSGYGIEEVKVVDDLRIRIQNVGPEGSQGDYNDSTCRYNVINAANIIGYPMARPLWEINNVKIKKGFGVVEPFTPFQAETFFDVTDQVEVVAATLAVDAVPATAVPAWSQVVHASNIGFGSGSWYFTQDPGNAGASIYQTAALTSGIGGTYDVGSVQTGVDANGNTLSWVEPGVAPTGIFAPPGSAIPGGAPFTADGVNFGNSNTIEYEAPNNSIVTTHPTGNSGWSYIKHALGVNEKYNTSDWYLVDVEYDENWLDASGNVVSIDPNTGVIGGGGGIAIPHAGTQSSFTEFGVVDPNGVGVSRGSGNNHHIGLIPVTRTEYGGPPKTVLRAIYQIAGNSKAATTNPSWVDYPDEFRLLTFWIQHGFKIDKIIVKKLNQGGDWVSWLNNSGVQVNNWTYQSGDASSPYVPQHAFNKRRIYHFNGKLCWELPAGENSTIAGQDDYHWKQDFGLNPPTVAVGSDSDSRWELSFTVSNNPKTNNAFTGNLRGFAAIEDLGAPNNYEGVYFKDIQEVGDYLIKFNFDGVISVSNWTFEKFDNTTNTYVDYTTIGSIEEASNLPPAEAICKNKLYFSPEVGNPTVGAQEYAISNIKLTDSMSIFSGGTAGSWSFDGFNTSLYNYIYWDESAMNIVFNGCPAADQSTGELKFINVNQQVDKTVNKNEKYEVSFTHGITAGSTAKLSIYYYNTDGFGFKIEDIDSNTAGNTGDISIDANGDLQYVFPTAQPFKQTVTIGSSEWSNINDDYSGYNADLKNSFVIQVKGDPNDPSVGVSGYIDNITMVQVFDGTNFEGTTVSFNESVRGWTSFKSFVPENGLSLSKKYFTFDQGGLYQHYVSLKKDINNDWVKGYTDNSTGNFIKWTNKEADNYNVFYNEELAADGAFSKITAVLNQEPSVVKMFNTINYEGSQTYVVKPSSSNEITINNAIAWSNGEDVKGWRCSQIKTDLDSGSVKEFIKKEGKWFNYIKGLNTNLSNTDTSLFSTQGVGVIDGVQDVTQYDADTGEEIILGGDVSIDPDQPTGDPNTPMPEAPNDGGNDGGGY